MVAPALNPPAPPTAIGTPMILERKTRDGRTLWYETTVLQQPERARACGSGPKSSADRRPIDPPPVVQIKIFEGPVKADAKDITFLYNADFFLYATLEHARPMAPGRGAAPPQTSPPVLTGMPVSSVCYLDRPAEAGYFLFPDLSVRHEGHYHLTFSLMEETKEERDKDPEVFSSGADEITGPEGRNFDFRMTVRTDDFSVYSAKKFPGLTESTALSRTVAEQGCRVRIRRDVRMRKRPANDKPRPAEAIDAANEQEYNRRRGAQDAARAPNHNPQHFRARSSSQASMDRGPSFGNDPHRRPSGPDYAPQASYSGQEPAANRHLSFQPPKGPYSHPQQQRGPSVPPSPSYPPRIAAQPAYEPPYGRRPSYHPYSQEPPPPPAQHQYQSSPLQQQFPASAAAAPPKREPYASGFRRPSSSDYSQHLSPATTEPETFDRSFQQPKQEKRTTLPSLESMMNDVEPLNYSRPPTYARSASVVNREQYRPAPPLASGEFRTLAPMHPIAPAPAPAPPLAPLDTSKKRSYEAFSPRAAESQRYTNGLREMPAEKRQQRGSFEAIPSRKMDVLEAERRNDEYRMSSPEYDRASGKINPVDEFPGCSLQAE